MTSISLLPIRSATPAQVAVACGRALAGVHDLVDPAILAKMVGRAGSDVSIQIICDDLGPAGWAGLLRYDELPDTWETTTFFAPRLRGTGLLSTARCIQAHMAEQLRVLHGPDIRVLTSISAANTRSRAATDRYAAAHDWPATGRLIHEGHMDRMSWIVEWPLPAPHSCHLADASPVAQEVA